MVLRQGHGNGAGVPRIEVLPADELPRGVQAEPQSGPTHIVGRPLGESFDPVPSIPPGEGSLARGPNAPQDPKIKAASRPRFAPGNIYAREGGKARARKQALLKAHNAPLDAAFAPFRKEGERLTHARVQELAQTVGGGHCGIAASGAAQSAGIQKAIESYAISLAETAESIPQKLELYKLAISAGNSSRQNNLAAHELCAREAEARRRNEPRRNLEQDLSS